MFNQSGLSLDQAPPLSVVLRFFVTASLLGIVAGVLLFIFGDSVFDASTKEARVLTHILALGVMGSFMLGALFQMLPVLAGVVLENPLKKATFVHTTFTLGVIMIALAFYTSRPLFFILASGLLGASLLYTTFIMISNLAKLKSHSSASRGMLIALSVFILTVLLGLYLLTALGGYHDSQYYSTIKQMHYSFGLFGWVSLLIVSVSFQVIEMFYVTPAFPKLLQRYFIPLIAFLLLFSSLSYVPIMIALLFIIYAGFNLYNLSKRKRPTSDGTVWFWRLGMGMLIVSMGFFISDITPLATITFIFFALSVVFAMVYKIVPFLVWFHLSNQGYMSAPLMFDIVHPTQIKQHFYLHIATFVSLLLAIKFQALIMIAALLVSTSFGLLFYRIIKAIMIYRHTQKHTQKISWS